jgi:hypothetical protein
MIDDRITYVFLAVIVCLSLFHVHAPFLVSGLYLKPSLITHVNPLLPVLYVPFSSCRFLVCALLPYVYKHYSSTGGSPVRNIWDIRQVSFTILFFSCLYMLIHLGYPPAA